MTRILGKEQLCSSEKKYFKSIQGFGDRTLFDRFPDIESVVSKKVTEKYRYFLAEPDDEGETITWYSKPYQETPRRLSELDGEERLIYEQLKKDTLAQYQKVIGDLKRENQTSEAEALESALRYINDDFIFCYDERVVLGTWGMQMKENYRESLGSVSKNLFKIKKKPPIVPPVVDQSPEIVAETPEPIESLHNIQFNAGEHGQIAGNSVLQKVFGQSISENEIPTVEPRPGYEFTGWDRNPSNFQAEGDSVFTAQYRPIIPPIVELPWYTRLWNWIRNFFFGRGCLRWLLWLLLFLLLLFLLLWLLQCCESKPKEIDDCAERIEKLERQIDSLNRRHKELDSLNRSHLELDSINKKPTKEVPGEPQACISGMDVLFLVDYSNSMDKQIEGIKNSINSIANTIEKESNNNYRLGLITFDEYESGNLSKYHSNNNYTALPSSQKFINKGNPSDQWITAWEKMRTNNISTFIAQLNKLNGAVAIGYGGKGPPEPSDIALNLVSSSAYGGHEYFGGRFRNGVSRIIILITDAPPSGNDDAETDEDITKVKGLRAQLFNQNIRVLLMTTSSPNALHDLAKGTGGAVYGEYGASTIIKAFETICLEKDK
jgi:hypothetical protein